MQEMARPMTMPATRVGHRRPVLPSRKRTHSDSMAMVAATITDSSTPQGS